MKSIDEINELRKYYVDEHMRLPWDLSAGNVINDMETIFAHIGELEQKLAKAKTALEFYSSTGGSYSCRLKSKFEGDRLVWFEDAENYFQDPHDLPILKDRGDLARQTLAEIGSDE